MNERGVGLIDIMIAVMVIGGGLLALNRLQGALVSSSAVSKQQSESSFIAQGVVENLRAKSWNDVALMLGTTILPDTVAKSAVYSVQYTVTQTGTDFKTVVVTVSWRDSNGQTHYSKTTTIFQKSNADGTARLLQSNTIGSGGSSSSSNSQSGVKE